MNFIGTARGKGNEEISVSLLATAFPGELRGCDYIPLRVGTGSCHEIKTELLSYGGSWVGDVFINGSIAS